MLTIKILFTINSLKKEKLFRQNSIYNSIHLKNKNIYVWSEKIHLIKKIYNNNKHGLKFWWNENIKMILTYRRTPLSRSKINRTHAWIVFKRQSSMKSPCRVLWKGVLEPLTRVYPP